MLQEVLLKKCNIESAYRSRYSPKSLKHKKPSCMLCLIIFQGDLEQSRVITIFLRSGPRLFAMDQYPGLPENTY